MDAANVLGHGIATTLPPSPYKMPSFVDPDFIKLTVERGYQDKSAPWVSPGLDPDLITVLVLIRLAPLSTIACRLWVAAGYPVREVSGGGHRCPTWRRHVLDKAIVVGADRRSRH